MPLNLHELHRAREAERRRLAAIIEAGIQEHLESDGSELQEIAYNMAVAFDGWRATAGVMGESDLSSWWDPFNVPATILRNTAEELSWRGKEAHKAMDRLVEILNPPPRFPDLNPSGEGTLVESYIHQSLSEHGATAEQFNKVFAALDDAVARAEQEGAQMYQAWVERHGGNKPTPRAYLRLDLNRCLSDSVKPRKRRARIIAAVEVALGLVGNDDMDAETRRVNSFLQAKGC